MINNNNNNNITNNNNNDDRDGDIGNVEFHWENGLATLRFKIKV